MGITIPSKTVFLIETAPWWRNHAWQILVLTDAITYYELSTSHASNPLWNLYHETIELSYPVMTKAVRVDIAHTYCVQINCPTTHCHWPKTLNRSIANLSKTLRSSKRVHNFWDVWHAMFVRRSYLQMHVKNNIQDRQMQPSNQRWMSVIIILLI